MTDRLTEICSLLSMNSPVYNMTSSLYSAQWQEGLYGLRNRASAHCHTFNPSSVSVVGHKGQLYAYLGLPSTNLLTDFTRQAYSYFMFMLIQCEKNRGSICW